ncbi:mannonate oxidoreductase [Bacteroidales bacterium]|nr:mannonate oxidoreductase [Bacteroidales bacterium]
MKIGDKINFLNAVGGGIVRRFKGKDIVYVEDADGFEIPVLITECIAANQQQAQVKSSSQKAVDMVQVKELPTPEVYEVVETPGGDVLNVFLAFLPIDIKDLGKCSYEAFLINDNNYFLYCNYMSRENKSWTSRFNGIIEPNTRLFIEEFSKEQLNDIEHLCFQFIAFKKDKPFLLKNSYSVEIRLDGVKFYKLHSFRENDFFDDDALIYPLVLKDSPERQLLVSSTELQEAMTEKMRIDRPRKQIIAPKKDRASEIIEVDLHINHLLDSTVGMSNTDILNVQLDKVREVLEEFKSKKGQKIVFIHGKGEGVLRNALLTELKLKYKHLSFQDASFKEYGFGATMVR